MPIIQNELSENSKGGTELLCERLKNSLSSELLDYFNIYPSRVRNYDKDKPSILWLHDLAEDPEAAKALQYDFDLIVFVSNWQYQQYMQKYDLSDRPCIVINNGIEPIQPLPKFDDKVGGSPFNPIKIVYHTTPHRGLPILAQAYDNIADKLKIEGIHTTLEIYSSFSIYGWPDRDNQFKDIIEFCQNHPGIKYSGAVDNNRIRQVLSGTHIFAYPSVWIETSCLAMIEAISAKNVVLHSNLGALIETSGGYTESYPFNKNPQNHLMIFERRLEKLIREIYENTYPLQKLDDAKSRVDSLYDWDYNSRRWTQVLTTVKNSIEALNASDSNG